MYSDPILRTRRFNRSVTAEVGALDHSFLGRGRPLGVARVLNAIGHGHDTLTALRRYLNLDAGLLSRLLHGLETDGLIDMAPDPDDARRRRVTLTRAGKREFQAYEKLSNRQAADMIARHPRPETLLAAMDLVATFLGRDRIEIQEVDPQDPASRYCLQQYYEELAQRFEQGFDVSLSRDPQAADMRRPRGSFLLALSDNWPIGCVGIKRTDEDMAEIKRLWVAPAARGLGLARRLMTQAETLARELGIRTLRLDTNRQLPEAQQLYRRSGWTEIPRFNDDPYPDTFFEKSL